ncbi:odorant receptor 82a-like [Andrena cerasifolii]|uniref:odorant receptor 82a-like n=1 Tax=Andrena cerasifolii TaxID=2819439 RepID=UPI004037C815
MQTIEEHCDSAESLGKACDYEKYVNLSIRWNRWLLKPMGLWPKPPNAPIIERSIYCLINAICYAVISSLFIPCGLYVVVEVEEFYDKLKLFGPLMFCLMAYMKYTLLILNADVVRECVDRIELDWRHVSHVQDRDIMVASATFGKRLVIICSFFMYSGALFYYIVIPIVGGLAVAEDENVTFIPMMLPVSRHIVDTRYSPVNEIVFSVQVLGGSLIHGISAGACSLAAAFAVHACGQMEVLNNRMEHLIDGREDMYNTVDRRIASIVSQHVRILEFLRLIEKALKQISLVEFVGCTLELCLLGYYIIVEWRMNDLTAAVTYSIILVSFTFNILIFCYIGEIVADQCKMVGEMSYMIEWYRLSGKGKLGLVLISAMSRSSMKLTAGNIIKLSLSSFTGVVKTSVTFLNMLRTFT